MRKLNESEFDELIYDDEETVLVFFHRKTCHVCRSLSGILLKLEDQYPQIVFAETDAEEEMNLFTRLGLLGVPQVVLFANGNLVKMISGQKEADVYKEALESLAGT